MSKLFGTDGIRGTVNAHPMTSRIAMDVAVAAGHVFREGLKHRPTVLIAKDTRLSGYQMEPAMVSGFTSAGWDVLLLGPMPPRRWPVAANDARRTSHVDLAQSYHDSIKLFGHGLQARRRSARSKPASRAWPTVRRARRA